MSSTITADPDCSIRSEMVLVDSGSLTRERGDVLSGSNTNFVIGLAMTALVTVAFASNIPVAIGLAGFTIAFYLVVGLYAQQNKLSGVLPRIGRLRCGRVNLCVLSGLDVCGFHGLAAFFIFKGMARARELGRGSVEAAAGT